ncbi:thiamine biosynthesis protein ThiI [Sinobaca qinghaiensis]|uniref:Probable tRNA sulfurtransferase n=1 Tax=Sinobaca qinghaiensis TaxID=342944 RepID=A0A419V793_9BACL|nr:tRNA uracil 4-sulfurtransferase ThiI [Sinobaca qinghaiensis]RKD75766.1 thiamine biosynthesis protein ThiI [Sinobaca qinghaiensis]
MIFDHIIVRYGELALKGQNRKLFEKQLLHNIRQVITAFPDVKAKRTYGRIIIELHGENGSEVAEKIRFVFGISSLSLAAKAENSIESIRSTALAVFKAYDGSKNTFKVSARRAYKNFPVSSQKVNPAVGGWILEHTEETSVDVHQPQVELTIDIREQGTYISCGRISGAKGLPVGSGGRGLLMLSGGIDSPVAGYLSLKRGVTIEAIHFHSPPYTTSHALQKVKDAAEVLSAYGADIRLHIVPFTSIQTGIRDHIHSSYQMTVTRRMMLRIAEKVAGRENIQAIINGESIGQVASQTIESMYTINEVTTMPVIRPLAAMDKEDVMELAETIGTYPISIRPYEDCCTIFLPTDSVTKPLRGKASRFENHFHYEPLVEEAVQQTETITISASAASAGGIDSLL